MVKKRPAIFDSAEKRRAKRRAEGCELDSEESLFLNDADHVSVEEEEDSQEEKEEEEEIILGTNLIKPGGSDCTAQWESHKTRRKHRRNTLQLETPTSQPSVLDNDQAAVQQAPTALTEARSPDVGTGPSATSNEKTHQIGF